MANKQLTFGRKEKVMQSKGTATLLVALVLCASIFIVTGVTHAPVGSSLPTQTYEATVPSADEKVVCIVFDDSWRS
jgi:hypothetical protein